MLLHYEIAGSGPAVVLLHSTATDARQWQPQLHALADEFTVLAPDLRGYGRSPLDPGTFSHAGDALELIDHLALDTVALVGSSGGGAVALQVASAIPDRVRALVLLCAAADGVEPTAAIRDFADRERALLETGDITGATELNEQMWLQPDVDDAARSLFRDMQTNAFRVQLAAGDDVEQDDLPVELAAITCPATVVSGARDIDWFTLVADHLAAELPAATRIDLPWAGHLPNMECPDDTTDLIRAALS